MSIEIRPAKAEEMEAFKGVAHTAIILPPGLFPAETTEAITPEMTLCAFVDGRLATSYAAWPLTIRNNGVGVPAAGITMVGTRPIYRRRGCLRQVITRHFESMHQRGEQTIAILHASAAAIYQRYGYAVVSTRNSYNTTPADLILTCQDALNPGATLYDLEEGQADPLKEVYDHFIADRTGYLERTPFIWRTGVLAEPHPGVRLQKIVYAEQGCPLGYLIYTLEFHIDQRGQLGQKMMVREFAWLSPSACCGLVQYLTRMDLVHEISWMRVAVDDPLPHLLLEPRNLSPSSGDGILARIVDLAAALPQRQYDEAGEIVMEIRDPLCQWNQGCWKLRVAGGQGSVSSCAEPPQVAMTIDTLAMLFFGQISATQALRMGRLQAANPEVVATCDGIFQTRYKPFCADIF